MDTNDKLRLRELAGKYADYALGEPMAHRRKKWRLHNRLESRTIPFHIEDNGTYLTDLMPPLQCEDEECRILEYRLLRAMTAYEKIDDDRIIPDRYVVPHVLSTSSYCEGIEFTRAKDAKGRSLGYESNKPIKDINEDFHKLKKRTITLDRELTEKRLELTQEAFNGLLPVEAGTLGSRYSEGIAVRATHLMGMQELYLQMAIDPDAVHRLLTFLAEDNLALGQWEEEQGLLTINNDGNQGYCSGSSQFSDEIPGREIPEGEPVLASDCYGYLEAQEAAGVSPEMYAEFLMPHFEKLAAKFKLLKFGCCEPVHDLMPYIQKLNGLRKVSVSPWCDLKKLAETCSKDVIWSRKPEPLKLCGEAFDPDDFRAHLEETLEAGKDHFVEFVFRDTCTMDGGMEQRIAHACDLIRDVTGHFEGRK